MDYRKSAAPVTTVTRNLDLMTRVQEIFMKQL